MVIEGCGRENVVLTFYKLRANAGSTTRRLERIACGQQAANSGGGHGVLLCGRCAEANRLRRGESKTLR